MLTMIKIKTQNTSTHLLYKELIICYKIVEYFIIMPIDCFKTRVTAPEFKNNKGG
jgi:hypothetical protein